MNMGKKEIYDEENPLISIIIPIFNTEEYLKECLDSILNQSLKNLEIICINDKTLDNSMKILKEYSNIDDRIKIIENEKNLGVSLSRNKGIDFSKGEYIIFLDSDDKLEYDSLTKLYNFSKKYDFDFVTTNVIRFNEKKKWTSVLHWIAIENEVLINADILEHPKLIFDTLSTNKFFKSSFLKEKNFKFEPGRIYEDILFSIKAYCSDAKIGICPKIYSHWIVRTGENKSSTQNVYNEKNVIDRSYIIRKEIEFLEGTKYSKLLDELYVKLLKIDFLQFINEIRDLDENYVKVLRGNIDPILKEIPTESFDKLDDISKLKYDLYLNNDDRLILLINYLREEYVRVKNLNEKINTKDLELNELNKKISLLEMEMEEINKNFEKVCQENNQMKERADEINQIYKKQEKEMKRIKSTNGWIKYKKNNLYKRFLKKMNKRIK